METKSSGSWPARRLVRMRLVRLLSTSCPSYWWNGDHYLGPAALLQLASRVENLTKTYGVPLIVTEDTRLALRDPGAVSLRRIDRVLVEGKSQPVVLHEVLDAESPVIRRGKLTNRIRIRRGPRLLRGARVRGGDRPLRARALCAAFRHRRTLPSAAGACRRSRRRGRWRRPRREELTETGASKILWIDGDAHS